jgi:cis-3-alkyl-4-acyloxetan-2-one decarboxylase / olefin beta-lactone synthetase
MNLDEIGRLPGRDPRNNVISFLEAHGRSTPERTALVWQRSRGDTATQSMTWGELLARTTAVAAGLRRLGLRAGDRVFLFVPMSSELYVAMFAVERLGGVAVFLDSWARREQLGLCARATEPKALIAPEAAFPLFDAAPEFRDVALRVVVGARRGAGTTTLAELVAEKGDVPIEPRVPKDTALITFTTGSSGVPKGADRTHAFLASQHRALERCLPYRPADLDLPTFPIFALNDLAGGVTTVIPAIDLARPAADDGEVLAAQIRAAGVTCATLSPSLLLAVARAAIENGAPLSSLRRVATGGAPVSRDDTALFRRAAPAAEVHILYGSTEVEPIAHLVDTEMPDEAGREGVCVGRLAEGLEHRLLRLHHGRVVLGPDGWAPWEPTCRAGELIVAGEHVCEGYWRNDDAFRATKVVGPDGRVWHRTGDICLLDDEGRLWMVGRVHNAILRGGEVLFPVRPEVAMRRLPFVLAAGYVGLPDPKLGERAVAAFAVRDGAAPADYAAEVRAALDAAGVVADEVVRVPSIPLDPRHHSKVEVAALRKMLLERTA